MKLLHIALSVVVAVAMCVGFLMHCRIVPFQSIRLASATARAYPGQSNEVSDRSAASAAAPMNGVLSRVLTEIRVMGPGQKGDADELMIGLEGLLTDANAAEIVRTLSAADSTTPFGLKALARWVHIDPVGAGRWLASCPTTGDEQIAVFMDEMTGRPQALVDFFAVVKPGGACDHFAAAAALKSHRTPEVALALIDRITPGELQTRAWESLILDWCNTDIIAASRWIAAIPDGNLRDRLAAWSVDARATFDPVGAIALADQAIGSDWIFDRTLKHIAVVVSESQPVPAVSVSAQRDRLEGAGDPHRF